MERNDDVVRCSIEKELIPKNPVNLKILLSTFEEKSSASATGGPASLLLRRRRRRGSGSGGDRDCDSEFVDHCQPSMAEVLTKFRQMEKSGRRGRGGKKRSSSVDRVQGRRSSVDDGKPDFWAGDQLDGDSPPPSQTTTLIALFSQMERKKKGTRRNLGLESRSLTRTEMEQRQAAKRNSREVSMTFQCHPTTHESEEMVEMPEEGLVQTLLTQWKALEKPNAKKKVWTRPTQVSRQWDIQRKGQADPGASNQATAPKHKTATASTTPKTTVVSKKITATPAQEISPKITTTAGPYTGRDFTSTNSRSAKVPLNDVTRSETGGGGGGGGRRGYEQVSGCPGPLEGFARNRTEKFRGMEVKNTNNDALPRKKSFKWEVKESSQLGGGGGGGGGGGEGRSINCVNRMDSHQPRLTSDLSKTLTPPSSPDFDDIDLRRKSEFFNRQPDLVEQSIRKPEGWKEEFPFPCHTKNLLERYEALLANN